MTWDGWFNWILLLCSCVSVQKEWAELFSWGKSSTEGGHGYKIHSMWAWHYSCICVCICLRRRHFPFSGLTLVRHSTSSRASTRCSWTHFMPKAHLTSSVGWYVMWLSHDIMCHTVLHAIQSSLVCVCVCPLFPWFFQSCDEHWLAEVASTGGTHVM